MHFQNQTKSLIRSITEKQFYSQNNPYCTSIYMDECTSKNNKFKELNEIIAMKQRKRQLRQNKENIESNILKKNIIFTKQITLKKSVEPLPETAKKSNSKRKLHLSINKNNSKQMLLSVNDSARSISVSSKKQKLNILSKHTNKKITCFEEIVVFEGSPQSKAQKSSNQKVVKNIQNEQVNLRNYYIEGKNSEHQETSEHPVFQDMHALIIKKIQDTRHFFVQRPLKTTRQIKELKQLKQQKEKKKVKLGKKIKTERNQMPQQQHIRLF